MALLLVALIRWESTLSFLGRYLIDSQPPQSADLILVLAGNFYGPRVLKGAELVTAGYAPLTLISGTPYEARAGRRGQAGGGQAITFLAKQGYSARLFESFPQNARSTIEEAIALRGELARRHVKRVILVTSTYHSRRSAIVFHLFCPGIDFISVPSPDPNYHPDGGRSKNSRSLFYSEWTKIAGTLVMAYPKDLIGRLVGN